MFQIKYKPNEKVRIVFIFQAASFWPSWESVWEACSKDDRFDARMYVCDDIIREKTQFNTARQFLDEKGIEYTHISNVNLSELKPHVIVLHTPYDGGHRPKYLHGNRLSADGYRVIYIPYGIEISDTGGARNDHFTGTVTPNTWRLYTFSPEMIKDYKRFSPTGGDMVRSFGHPKFDGLVNRKTHSLPDEIRQLAKGRKVILWKVHFPKRVGGKLITPSMQEYLKFAKTLAEYDDLFFVFMPHPKFYEVLGKFINKSQFQNTLESAENLFQFFDDDYRDVLLSCDYYMIDRSAIMIEAGITGKPIVYLKNHSYAEPMTAPVQKIVDSYYQASDCAGMGKFIKDVVYGQDDLKESRNAVFKEVLPDCDGNSGERIKEDIYNSLTSE